MFRRQLSLASNCLDTWGDLSIFQEKGLRGQVAQSVAARLALSPEFMKEKMDQLHRITDYEESRSGHSE